MVHIGLFDGIGGFSLAAEAAGWTNIVMCEKGFYQSLVSKYWWPNAYHHDDVKTLTAKIIDEEATKRLGADWRANGVVLSGGFPCQPYSTAGKRRGTSDPRHLWPEMLRIIGELRPDWVVAENVLGLTTWAKGAVFRGIIDDLEGEGYGGQVQAFTIPASACGAPHIRERVWFIASNTNRHRGKREGEDSTYPKGEGVLTLTGGAYQVETSIPSYSTEVGQWREADEELEPKLPTENDESKWLLADTDKKRFGWEQIARGIGEKKGGKILKRHGASEASRFRSYLRRGHEAFRDFPSQRPLCGGDDGLPNGMDTDATT